MKRTLALMVLAFCATAALASKKSAKSDGVFYVYSDKGSMLNHYIPSGWMGDFGDLKYNDAERDNPADGQTCIKITYTGEAKQNANWAGIYWQYPVNNWGDRQQPNYDLTGYKRLTFYARGAKGGEKIAEFKIGGISGEHGDSDGVNIGPIELTKDWKKYTIELADKNLSHIIGGFCFSASRDDNPDGYVMYLDEIRFEK